MAIFSEINKHFFWVIIGVLSFLLCLGFLGLGVFPDDPSPLDWSWKLALHYFFLSKKAFGQEIIFPLGPYGFLYSKTYFPGTYFLTATIWLVLSLVFWWSSFLLAYKRLKHSSKLIAVFISFIWFLGLLFFLLCPLPDAFFMSFSIFLLTFYFYIDEKKTSYLSIILTICLSLICLIKFSFTGSTLLIIFLVTISDFLEKQKPIVLVTFLVAFLSLWLLASQPLLAIPSFIINGLTVAQYYSELAIGGTFSEILLVLFVILLVILPVLFNELEKRTPPSLLFLLGLLGLSLMAFKAGYTRIDQFHVYTTNKVLIAIALFYLIICFSQEVKYYVKYLSIVGLLVAIIFFGANLSWYGKTSLLEYIKLGLSIFTSNITSTVSLIEGKTNLSELYKDKMAKMRQANPIIPVTGSVDIYPFRQDLLLAHNLAYQPRPVFQSNMTTPTRVAEINSNYLKSKNAPKNIFFNIDPIDSRFPSLDDGLSWPELLTLYDIKSFIPKNSLLLLNLSQTPRSFSIKAESSQEIKFNQEIDLSQINNNQVWVKFNIEPTFIGKLASAAWRTPIVYLRITLANGYQYFHCLPREMAKTGFLLSPLVSNSVDFAKLASKEWQTELSQNTIKSFSVLVENGQPTDWFFQPNISVSFASLEFPKQDLSSLLTSIKQEQEQVTKNLETSQLVNLSLTQIQQGDFLQAIINCEKAIKIDPKSYIAYNNLGISYLSLSLFNEAIAAFEQAIKINPDFQLAKNNLNDAVNQKASKVDNEKVLTNYTSLALHYINNNMFEKAILSSEASLKINPNYVIAYNNICVAYNGLGLWDKAIIAGEKAVEIAPDFQLARNNLAWAKSQKEKAVSK